MIPTPRHRRRRVYPRVYGATKQQAKLEIQQRGLSPCVRGYLGQDEDVTVYMGSIPVCTGLPPADALRPYSGWVYPRVYGATKIVSYVPSSVKGLSPCVRGYRVFRRRVPGDRGSIPVCTGLPGPDHRRSAAWRVYPRVYGATMHWPVYICGCMGLSPCVRGYLLRPPPTRTAWGSIPVCTGLPGSGCLKRHERRVYPRVYGATMHWPVYICGCMGLSPCVRGYHTERSSYATDCGSIPVCTGLPLPLP